MVAEGTPAAPLRVHFAYRHVDKPWGGANNFIRALNGTMRASTRFVLTDTIEEECDVLFMNQLGRGPGGASGTWSLRDIEALCRSAPRRLLVRAVNLNAHAFRMGVRNFLFGRRADRETVALLNRADHVIFQSAYQKSFFTAAGYRGRSDTIIHNGADSRFWVEDPVLPAAAGVLRLVSSTASPRESKCHYIAARLSQLPNVELRHLGAWPEKTAKGKVQLLGTLAPQDMVQVLRQAHFMVHPAIKDPCPNAVFEAVCAGLPVIYNPGPGSSSEIVGECGFALDENNLASTVEQAWRRLASLRETVRQQRARYRIEHAAALYCRQFEQVAQRAC